MFNPYIVRSKRALEPPHPPPYNPPFTTVCTTSYVLLYMLVYDAMMQHKRVLQYEHIIHKDNMFRLRKCYIFKSIETQNATLKLFRPSGV